MDAPSDHAVTIATTEHFTLQTARAATVSESNGRATLFLGAVSSGAVALAFVGQVSGLDTGFLTFGLVVLPVLFFLGLVTFDRVLQSAVEDLTYARRINDVRRFYLASAPELVYYLAPTADDRPNAVMETVGLRPGPLQPFLTGRRHGRGAHRRAGRSGRVVRCRSRRSTAGRTGDHRRSDCQCARSRRHAPDSVARVAPGNVRRVGDR